jgi:hypothetical protein
MITSPRCGLLRLHPDKHGSARLPASENVHGMVRRRLKGKSNHQQRRYRQPALPENEAKAPTSLYRSGYSKASPLLQTDYIHSTGPPRFQMPPAQEESIGWATNRLPASRASRGDTRPSHDSLTQESSPPGIGAAGEGGK